MTIRPVDLVDYVAIAAEITGMDAATIARLPNLALAESALHAPFAGFGDHEFYPEFVDKAAVLLERLARNHPLPDGNKRAAWVSLRFSPSPPASGTTRESALGGAHTSGQLRQVGKSRAGEAAG